MADYYSWSLYGLQKLYFGRNTKMTNGQQMLNCINAGIQEDNDHQLMLHHDLHTFLSKLDPDLCYYSGIRYKSELDDCGVSVDGHAKGNGWKVRISWDNDTHTLWSPNLKALLNGALEFLKERVKV